MNIFISVIFFLSLITGGYGKCFTTIELTEDITIDSPGFPSYRGRHQCPKYKHGYNSPPDTTMTIECTDFAVQCRGQQNFFGVTDGTKKCGKAFPKVTTSTNFLGVEYQARLNRIGIASRRSIFRFQCEIKINYPEPIVSSPCDCPVWNSPLSNRIIAGTDADEGEFPFHVAIMKYGEYICGGSLIADKWVATSSNYHIGTSHQVRMGVTNINTVSPNEVTRNIISVTPHPRKNPRNHHFDISLAELDEPVTFTPFIRPICLPDDLLEQTLENNVAIATGWGKTSTDEGVELPDVLQKVTLNIISNYDCAAVYGTDIYDESICTLTDGKDTCKYDAGGPLSYYVNGKVYLIGTTSWGRGCALRGTPSVYTRVSSPAVLYWIRETIGVTCGSYSLPSDMMPEIHDAIDSLEVPYSCETCGQRMPQFLQNRIVGGETAQEGEFPYLVSFSFHGEHYCGGSLISNYWVVTAAHCSISKYLDAVILGQYNINYQSNNQISHLIADILMHPLYNDETQRYDVALVKLRDPVNFTDYIQPICLPDIFTDETFVGKLLEASGWGSLTYEGDDPTLLQKVTLNAIGNVKCKLLNGENVNDLNICCLTSGKDTCQGDSGGPLAYQQHGRSYLIGITSWGYGCALPNSPGVYTRVSHPTILSWIKENAGITCSAP